MTPTLDDINSVELWVGVAVLVLESEVLPFGVNTKRFFVYCATHTGSCAEFGCKVDRKLARSGWKIIAFSSVTLAKNLEKVPLSLAVLIDEARDDDWLCARHGGDSEDEQDVFMSEFLE